MKVTKTNQKNGEITELVLKLQTEIKKNEAQMKAINEELEKNPRYSVAEIEKILTKYNNCGVDFLIELLKDKKKVQEILK